MEKRQKILLVIMALVLVWGGYTQFFADGDTAKPTARQDEAAARQKVAAVVEQVTKSANAQSLTDGERHMVAQVAAAPAEMPFYSSEENFYLAGSGPSESDADVSNYKYNGYMEVGGKVFAIINGMEYTVGEELESSGFVVTRITRGTVDIEKSDDSGLRPVTRKIPFVEEETEEVPIKVVK